MHCSLFWPICSKNAKYPYSKNPPIRDVLWPMGKFIWVNFWKTLTPDLTSFWPTGKPMWGNWQMIMMLHNYRYRPFCRTLNIENPSSNFRDKHCIILAPTCTRFDMSFGPWTSLYGAYGEMTMTLHHYNSIVSSIEYIPPAFQIHIHVTKSGPHWY